MVRVALFRSAEVPGTPRLQCPHPIASADEAFADLLSKHGRPTDLKTALRQNVADTDTTSSGLGQARRGKEDGAQRQRVISNGIVIRPLHPPLSRPQ
jgi:hypothetical protein